MPFSEEFLSPDDLHPIDIVETLAEHHAWEFDRVTDDQIAMAVEGQWRTYSLTLAWSAQDETLRLICTFEMEPPTGPDGRTLRRAEPLQRYGLDRRFHLLDRTKADGLALWLVLAGGQMAGPEQIDRLISSAVLAAERFYPAFQLVGWADKSPADAMKVAIAEAYGRA